MQFFAQLLLLLELLAFASASPARIQKRGVYKVERVPNPSFTGRNGRRDLYKALSKFRLPLPASLVDEIQKEDMITKRSPRNRAHNGHMGFGNVAAFGGAGYGPVEQAAGGTTAPEVKATTNANNTALVVNTPVNGGVEYLAPVNIGGQVVNMDFDSGSSDLWVFNTQLSNQATTGHTLYDPTTSKTFALMQGASFEISYGDGSGAAGNVGTDTVNIGGASATKQAVELATAVSQSFVEDSENNGLVGLAFSDLNTVQPQQQKTFFANVQDSLAEPLFTADLRATTNGAYEFGAIDTSKFVGTMNWAAVNTSQGFWQFSTQTFSIDGGATQQQATANNQAIADTGTTLMLADPSVVKAYYAKVTGAKNDAQQGGFVYPCDSDLPNLQIDIGGNMATVKGADINFTAIDNTNCFGGLQETTQPGLGIFGDVFFKSNFVAFNGGNNSLGVATHA
ncbi:acid protease [Xylariaceae sp. FL0804]|nr:acid protease [Xylariaceae sp. FL0804]